MEVRLNQTMPRDYAKLQIRSGRERHTALAVTGALRDSLLTVGVYDDGELVGFGRVIGDGFMYYVVCDVMTDPDYRKYNLDYIVLKEIDDYFLATRTRECTVYLIADRPFDEEYLKNGYRYIDPDLQIVMKK